MDQVAWMALLHHHVRDGSLRRYVTKGVLPPIERLSLITCQDEWHLNEDHRAENTP